MQAIASSELFFRPNSATRVIVALPCVPTLFVPVFSFSTRLIFSPCRLFSARLICFSFSIFRTNPSAKRHTVAVLLHLICADNTISARSGSALYYTSLMTKYSIGSRRNRSKAEQNTEYERVAIFERVISRQRLKRILRNIRFSSTLEREECLNFISPWSIVSGFFYEIN